MTDGASSSLRQGKIRSQWLMDTCTDCQNHPRLLAVSRREIVNHV